VSILVVGSANIDYTLSVDRLPTPGETVLAPLSRLRTHANVHGRSGLDGAELPISRRQSEAMDAIDFIAQQASSPGEVSIIATGPLTNLARALSQYPQIASGIASLSIMGGTAGLGNTTPVAEFNAFSDPEALDAVLAYP
jgi:inosine-uridine nucleoside N-ribohydrolase